MIIKKLLHIFVEITTRYLTKLLGQSSYLNIFLQFRLPSHCSDLIVQQTSYMSALITPVQAWGRTYEVKKSA